MRLSRFFITRPIFAAVIAILITVMGAIAYFGLPVSQYPDIVPPTVTVTATYPGADAETVASTVAAPLEQEINGVDNMIYMSSQSTGDGNLTITVTFKQGTDLNAAQVLVQNRVAIAAPRLPQEVQRLGIVTRKTSPDFLMVVNLISPDHSLDRGYISNYALTQVRDRIARLDGVGDARLFGARDYAMRIWIDPNKAAALNLTAGEIVDALRAQNVQVAAGTLGQPPYATGSAYQINVETQGRLTDPATVRQRRHPHRRRRPSGPRVGRGAGRARRRRLCRQHLSVGRTDRDPRRVPAARAPTRLPPRLRSRPRWNACPRASRRALSIGSSTTRPNSSRSPLPQYAKRLLEAIALVVLVVIVFLQRWRAAIIPVVAIPVSLIGTFAILLAVGYSLNNLSLFGLVLAIGIVVDDAIVVVENVERNLARGLTGLEAARTSMDEVGAALIAIVLVLCAVFLPTLFLNGLAGAFYHQFAVTIAGATVISLLVSLTLSPALAAILLKPH